MHTAVYLRVSSEEQRDRQSIENQRQYAERYFQQHTIERVEYYVDDGISGTLPLADRPDGKRLLADAQAGRVKVLFIYKVDRLGREALVTLQAAEELWKAGVVLHSMTESIDSVTPHGRLSLVMLCGIAGYERDSLVERSIQGTNRLAREGAWLGGIVPFGYVVTGTGGAARLEPSESLIPGLDMSEAAVVEMIYRLCAEEGLSCQKIADRLNKLGVPTVYLRDGRTNRRGKRQVRTSGLWRAGRILNIIKNPNYKGIDEYGKRSKKVRETIERTVPAMVDSGLWQRAQETLHRNMRFSPRNGKQQYLLRGLIKCGECNLTYSGSFYTTKDGTI